MYQVTPRQDGEPINFSLEETAGIFLGVLNPDGEIVRDAHAGAENVLYDVNIPSIDPVPDALKPKCYFDSKECFGRLINAAINFPRKSATEYDKIDPKKNDGMYREQRPVV